MNSFDKITLTLEKTDIPDPNFIGYPVESHLTFNEHGINIHCIRSGTVAGDGEFIFEIITNDIVNVFVNYVADPSDEMLSNPYYHDKIECSELIFSIRIHLELLNILLLCLHLSNPTGLRPLLRY